MRQALFPARGFTPALLRLGSAAAGDPTGVTSATTGGPSAAAPSGLGALLHRPRLPRFAELRGYGRALGGAAIGGHRSGAFSPSAPPPRGPPGPPVSKTCSAPLGPPRGGAGARCARAPVRPRWAKTRSGPRPAARAGGPFRTHIPAHGIYTFPETFTRPGPEPGPKCYAPNLVPIPRGSARGIDTRPLRPQTRTPERRVGTKGQGIRSGLNLSSPTSSRAGRTHASLGRVRAGPDPARHEQRRRAGRGARRRGRDATQCRRRRHSCAQTAQPSGAHERAGQALRRAPRARSGRLVTSQGSPPSPDSETTEPREQDGARRLDRRRRPRSPSALRPRPGPRATPAPRERGAGPGALSARGGSTRPGTSPELALTLAGW